MPTSNFTFVGMTARSLSWKPARRDTPKRAASRSPSIRADYAVPESTLVQLTPPKDDGREPRPPQERVADAIFVPTPQDVVEKMLEAANVGKDDLLYDLG